MKPETDAQLFAKSLADRLMAAGLRDAELQSLTYEPAHFGNGEAIFRVGALLLRIVRDRSQDLLDVASNVVPTQFHPVEDIEVAMGWKAMSEILTRKEPEQLDPVLSRLARHFDELSDALSGDRERLTRARIEKATRERGQAFISRLRGGK
jgi:hypothetical protein